MKTGIKKKYGLIFIGVLLQGCSHLDNYMLGKDNTPQPAPLKPIKTKTHLVQQWTVPIGKASTTSNAYLKLQPVILQGIIYTADTNGQVHAVNESSGKIIWTKQLPEGILSGPSIQNGYIALCTNRSNVVLLKQSDGTQLWQTKLSSDSLSAPVIAQKNVLVKTIDGTVYALNLQTGEKIWTTSHGAPNLILKASASPVVMDKLALIGFSDGRLSAIDIENGHTVWERGVAYANGSSDIERLVDIDADPIVQGNTVYLATYQGYLGALSLTDGEFIWRKPASIYKNMVMDNTTLYLTDSDDIVWAINKQDGSVKWKQLALKARGLTEPVLIGNQLIVGDKTGLLHSLAKQNGELTGRTQLGSAIHIAPSVAGNHLYVLTANGKLNYLSVGTA